MHMSIDKVKNKKLSVPRPWRYACNKLEKDSHRDPGYVLYTTTSMHIRKACTKFMSVVKPLCMQHICDRACDNRACGHMIFAYFFSFIIHNVLYHYAMELQFSALSKHLIGIMMQITEWKYTFPVLRYNL